MGIRSRVSTSVAVAAATAVLVWAAGFPAALGADATVVVDVVESTADGTVRRAASQRLVIPGEAPGAPVVEVRTDRPRQRLHGVGAALTESSAYLLAQLPAAERRAALEALFGAGSGDLSVVRLVIGASDFSLEHRSLNDSPVPDPELTRFSIERDRRWVIPVLREILAVAPDIEIIASPWSAPGWMKDSGSYLFGTLEPQHEAAYARYLVRYLEAFRDEGIDVDWLTLQNEPAAVQLDYPSMLMGPDQQSRLLRDHLSPALVRSDLGTRALVWDHNWCDAKPPGGCVGPAPASFPLDVLGSAGAFHPVAGVGYHCYGGDQVVANEAIHDRWPDLQIWHTECSGGTWQTDPFAATARLALTDRNHWANATVLWNLALDPDNGPHLGGCGTCRGVVTVDPQLARWDPEVELDVLATVARFGPQGSGALETTSSDPEIVASGVCSPSGRPAAVVFNPGAGQTVIVRFGELTLPIELAEGSLTAVRAPDGVGCALAAWPALPASLPPAPVTTPPAPDAPAPLPSSPAAPATPIAGSARYTG